MDNNDFYYILMSSLKHPYRDHMTKESTSLLMKELDQAASCVAHHAGHGHQQSTSNSAHASTSTAFLANNHRQHLNNHHQRRWDGLTFGSPKSPENVARTILRALGASSEEKETPSAAASVVIAGASLANAAAASTSSRTVGDIRRRSTSSGSISHSAPLHLTNGHHQQHHPRQSSHLQQLRYQNQSSSILSRCRRKLHLQLTRVNGAAAAAGSSSPPPEPRKSRRAQSHSKRQSVVLATNGHEDHPSSISASDEGATPSSQQFGSWPVKALPPSSAVVDSPSRRFVIPDSSKAASSALGREEHQLIAYNSSLLMVKPTTNPVSLAMHQHHRHTEGGVLESGGESSSSSSESSAGDSFAPPPPPPPPPPNGTDEILETAILDSDTSQSQKSSTTGRHPYHRRDIEEGISVMEPNEVLIEHHPPPISYSQQQLHQQEEHAQHQEAITPTGTITSTEPEPSPDMIQGQSGGGVGLAVAPHAISSDSTPATGSSLQRIHNRLCTSYRLKIPLMKNPVDLCLLPNDDVAIADYDNGLLIINDLGELVEHKKTFHEVNACGVACVRGGPCSPSFRIFLLVVRDGVWTINVYRNFELVEMARCPSDPQIENWALRRLVVCIDTRLHLLASGETKSTIWTYEFERGEWRILVSENSGGRKATSGNYNDMSVKFNKDTKETRIVLCEWKKAQLWTLFLNDKTDVMEEKSIKMKRVKGQEWIIQGPHLAVLDEQADILVYDGSGKLFLFDGESYRCKKIVADLGRGEVSAIAVADGWVYALCRYKRCIEAFMYKENDETHI